MSTQAKPKRKTHDVEFKKQAVQMVISSGRTMTQIARELGVSPGNLRNWRERYQPELAQQSATLEALRPRPAQLERDNLQLRRQRDVLKTTLGIGSMT